MVSAVRDSQSLTCQRMTVSLVHEGKLVPGGEAADQRANIPCTPAMMEKSQLCRDQCAADAPSSLLEEGVFPFRRDLTMVARHEMPGMGAITDPSG
jgi:hypothetical protein